MKGTASPPAALHALDALDRLIASAPDLPKVRVNGVVIEVAPAFCRVSGLSPFVKLGECIELDTGGKPQLGEVVRIDESGVTVKPFETTMKAGLGTTARRRGFVTISPHPSWKGRIVNALGAPIDDGAPVVPRRTPRSQRSRAAAGHAPAARPHAAEDRRQGHRFLHAALCRAAHRHFRGLRHRQVDAARHARPLPRLRHRRHRAGRRTRPRGARLPGGCAQAAAQARCHRGRHRR